MTALEQLRAVEQDALIVRDVSVVRADPHPYVIGPKHLQYNDSMYLGDKQIKEMEAKHGPMCAYGNGRGGKCRVRYEQHKTEVGAFVSAARNLTREELKAALLALKPVAEANNIVGFAFIKNEYTIEGMGD